MKGVYIITSRNCEVNEYFILGVYKKRKIAMRKLKELKEEYNCDEEIIKRGNEAWFEGNSTSIKLDYHLLNDEDCDEDEEL